jgi:hypothetical protein
MSPCSKVFNPVLFALRERENYYSQRQCERWQVKSIVPREFRPASEIDCPQTTDNAQPWIICDFLNGRVQAEFRKVRRPAGCSGFFAVNKNPELAGVGLDGTV